MSNHNILMTGETLILLISFVDIHFPHMPLQRGDYVVEGKPHKQGFSLEVLTHVDTMKPDPAALARGQR